jgi:two-component system chemotaxis response regulator CheY
MIVEDSRVVRCILRDCLEKDGNRVLEATNGGEALSMLKTEKPNLLITDIVMPETDGLTLIGEIHKMPEFAAMPILVVSSESSDRMKNWGKERGVTGWVVKPFHPDRIREVVQRTLRSNGKAAEPEKQTVGAQES